MQGPKLDATRALSAITILAIGAAILLIGLQGVIDTKNHAAIPVVDAGMSALGITLIVAAIGNSIGRPFAGGAVGLVMASTALITWAVRCLMVLLD